MAEKRMFSNTITKSDAFLSLSASAQALYFHLSMEADDDGFVNNPKAIMRLTNANEDDLNLLILKKFIIPFEVLNDDHVTTFITVIKHWFIHNTLRADRKKSTNYIQQKDMLILDDNGAYSLINRELQPNDNQVATNCPHSIDKYSVVEISVDKDICADSFSKENAFEVFWERYPKKLNKSKAKIAFNRECKSEEKLKIILDALEQHKKQDDWMKENGKFIPHPTTWLNGRRWEDEINESSNERPRYTNTKITRV